MSPRSVNHSSIHSLVSPSSHTHTYTHNHHNVSNKRVCISVKKCYDSFIGYTTNVSFCWSTKCDVSIEKESNLSVLLVHFDIDVGGDCKIFISLFTAQKNNSKKSSKCSNSIILPRVSFYIFIAEFLLVYLLLYRIIGLVGRVFGNGPGDQGSIQGVIPKTLKMVLDTSLLNTQQYKVPVV